MKLLFPTNPITEYERSNTASIPYLFVCRGIASGRVLCAFHVHGVPVHLFYVTFIRSKYAFEFHIIGNFERNVDIV